MSKTGELEACVLEMRAAPGRVGGDRLGTRGCERRDGAPGTLEPFLPPARVQMQRPAATVVGRHDLVAVRREHARRGAVDLAEEDRLDTAGEQADAAEALVGRRGFAGRADVLEPGWCECLQRGERSRRREGRKAEHLTQPSRMGKHREDETAQQPLTKRPRHLVLDALAGELDEPVVLNARGAGGEAGHAAKAAIEVFGDRAVELDRSLECCLHQPDPSAR